jgi:hypothetical protein
VFVNILPTRIVSEVSEHGLLHDEQFGFKPIHSTVPQLAGLIEKELWQEEANRLVFLDTV